MKGYAKPLQELIEGHKIQFEIPVYQRYYDWADENCEQLLTDLVKLSKSNPGSTHLFFRRNYINIVCMENLNNLLF